MGRESTPAGTNAAGPGSRHRSRRSPSMTRLPVPFRLRLPGPAVLFCALALLVVACRPPAAAAVPAGVPLAWGLNERGQLGNGTYTDSPVPVRVSSLSNVVAVAGGADHSLALRAEGTVFGPK